MVERGWSSSEGKEKFGPEQLIRLVTVFNFNPKYLRQDWCKFIVESGHIKLFNVAILFRPSSRTSSDRVLVHIREMVRNEKTVSYRSILLDACATVHITHEERLLIVADTIDWKRWRWPGRNGGS